MKTIKNKRSAIALATFCLAFGLAAQARAALTKVLFIGNDYNVAATFSDIMQSDPRFDIANSAYQQHQGDGYVPTLAYLQQFDSVLLWSNFSPGDGTSALGDVLADYADGGGGVVLATFDGLYQSFGGITGRINTPGYNPLTGGTTDGYHSVSLGAYNPLNPLMAGVTSLSSLYYNGDWLSVDAGATVAASWSNGRPLAAINASGNVATISLFPNVAMFGHATGNYDELFRNALAETGNFSAVPEPSTYIAGALLLLPFGAQVLRRLRTRKQAA